ncbi:MAG: CBS domain-containing protein [Chitinispirillaceae bacterium]|nr:CBS domain-containing protein [Chitinispirillaceae bacterium]
MSIETILNGKPAELTTCRKECTVLQCIQKMNEKKIGAVIVIDEKGKTDGIITERDVLRFVDSKQGVPVSVTVSEIMTPRERLVSADRTESIETLMNTMTQKRIRHIPIIENDELIGVISIGDVVKALLEKALLENQSMKNYISGV